MGNVSLSTSDFTNWALEREAPYEGLEENSVLLSEYAVTDNDFFSVCTFSLKEKKTSWTNSVCYNFGKGILFFYDTNYFREGLPFFYGEDPFKPYQAAIKFGNVKRVNGRISSDIDYGSFYYDASGRLRTVRTGQITYSQFQPLLPIVDFRQDGDSWAVYAVGDFQKAMLEYFDSHESIKPKEKVSLGDEVEFFEMIYSVSEENNRLALVQRSMTGNVKKLITVPFEIEIDRWKELLAPGEWPKSFAEYSSFIEISK